MVAVADIESVVLPCVGPDHSHHRSLEVVVADMIAVDRKTLVAVARGPDKRVVGVVEIGN